MRLPEAAFARALRSVTLGGIAAFLCACDSSSDSMVSVGAYMDAADPGVGESRAYFPPPNNERAWRSLVKVNSEPGDEQKAWIRRVTGIDWDALRGAWDLSEELGSGSTVLVIKNGWVVGEWGSSRRYHVASVTKSLTSLATLRMIDLSEMGELEREISLDSPAYLYLPKAFAESDAQKRDITIKHLLTMSPGIRPVDPDQLDLDERLEYPMESDVGDEWVYSSLPPNLLSMIIQDVTGRNLGDFFNAEIASPIGASPLRWDDIDGGYTKGAAGASVDARDLARIAYLTLHNGVWGSPDGYKQIIDSEKLRQTVRWAPELTDAEFRRSPGSPFPLPPDAPNHYGHLWWTNRTNVALGPDVPSDAYYMHGFRDNLAVVVPSENLVVVRLARRGPPTDTAFRREFMSLVMSAIVDRNIGTVTLAESKN